MKHTRLQHARRGALKRLSVWAVAAVMAVGSQLALVPTAVSAADCLDTNTKPTATVKVAVPQDGTYRIWTKMQTSAATANSYMLAVDDQQCLTIGDTPLTTAWSWIGHQDGNTAAKATLQLSAGEHTIKLIGTEAGLKVAKVLLLGDVDCEPTDNGDNCTTSTPVDTEVPTVPTTVKATIVSSSAITVSWAASQDNVGVSGYDVYRSTGANAATKVHTTTATQFNDSGLSAATTYSYYVVARDEAGNQSAASATVSAKTMSQTTVGKGKLYGQVKFSRSDAPVATISFSVDGQTRSYQSDSNGYYYITDIPAGTYSVKYQAGNAYKYVSVRIIARSDTVKDVTLPRSTTTATTTALLAATNQPFAVVDLDNATLSNNATRVIENGVNVLQLGTAAPDPDPGTGPDPNKHNCIVKPSACGYPDETNTGYRPTGVGLTTMPLNAPGELVIREAGTVIDGKRIEGCVQVYAPNVTIKRSLLTGCQSYFNVHLRPQATNFTIEDTEIDGKDFASQDAAITEDSTGPVTIRRVFIHNVGDGPRVGENLVMEDSYITDMFACSICHNDSVQSAGGFNVTLRHNTMINTPPDHPSGQGGRNAVVRIATEQGPVDGFVVENNLLSGGNFAIQIRSQGTGAPRNVKILNNRIVPNWRFYGAYDSPDMLPELSGNFRDDSGAPLNTL